MQVMRELELMKTQHLALRTRIERLLGLLEMPFIDVERVSEEIGLLAGEMTHHIRDEEESIPPLLVAIGTVGAAHAAELFLAHKAEHAAMVRGLDDALEGGRFDPAWKEPLKETLFVLLQHMDHEELQFLNEDVLGRRKAIGTQLRS